MYKDILAIAGVPRSGTSWLGQIIDSSPDVAYRFQPIFSYAFKDRVNIDSTQEEYEAFFKGIYESQDDFLLQTDKRLEGLYPTFLNKKEAPDFLAFKECRYQYLLIKMLYYFKNLKLIGIIRHPCGAINSWLKNPKEFPQDLDPLKEWRFGSCRNQGRSEEFFGFMKWKEVAHLYLDLKEKYSDRVHIVKYDELVDAPLNVSREIFKFARLEFTEQTESFINSCHSTSKEGPYAVYKDRSVRDKWMTELDPFIRDEIVEEIKGTRLARFL